MSAVEPLRVEATSKRGRLSETQWARSAQQRVVRLAQLQVVHDAFDWLHRKEFQLQERQIELAKIPAPPFGEAARADWLQFRFRELGLKDIHTDAVGNVLAILPGANTSAGYVSISAHLDTVFPAETKLDIKRDRDRMVGPGISDNAAGVVAMLAIAGAIKDGRIRPSAPILFIGNVGEEGEGNLRGVRHIFDDTRWKDAIEFSIILDGAGTDSIIAEGLGSRRYEVRVNGPGGHSWSDFGAPNPIVILSKIIQEFSATSLPSKPKTTYNIGVIQGGTSVNSIPEMACMRVDLRSVAVAEIERLEEALRRAADSAKTRDVEIEIRTIGDRPAGELKSDSPMLAMVRAVDAHLSITSRIQRASTDANIPLSQGREAIALGAGGTGAGAHTLHEWFDPYGREVGLKRILLLTLALTGIDE
ncbi:peptidase M20 [Candidatus Koribacter versatilis Ellin345]|uniref:Peptidase M20 n=1 Tax=Koribacter versatilis (strain Ellin345) TaxID=204669 RepID=Q1IRQ6_KORVE|nr:M20/M25/M40 family metallo-hydrolase [Candidatus Koribacter versatilis]ABF40444.1 peptidase M20 [Candidatus Koribacter versatilis Ellin345]